MTEQIDLSKNSKMDKDLHELLEYLADEYYFAPAGSDAAFNHRLIIVQMLGIALGFWDEKYAEDAVLMARHRAGR